MARFSSSALRTMDLHPGDDRQAFADRLSPLRVIGDATIRVFVADDNLIVREGVRALLVREPDIVVVGVGADYEDLSTGVEVSIPQVLVVDIRMPPTFQREGIDAAKLLRKRHPG